MTCLTPEREEKIRVSLQSSIDWKHIKPSAWDTGPYADIKILLAEIAALRRSEAKLLSRVEKLRAVLKAATYYSEEGPLRAREALARDDEEAKP